MVSVKSYRIQLSSASCNFSENTLYLVHAMYGGHGFCGFVLMLIGKMAILTIFLQLQDNIKLFERFEGCYYTRLESYYIIFYFETDWSRIRPLPSTTLKLTRSEVETIFYVMMALGVLLMTGKLIFVCTMYECLCNVQYMFCLFLS